MHSSHCRHSSPASRSPVHLHQWDTGASVIILLLRPTYSSSMLVLPLFLGEMGMGANDGGDNDVAEEQTQ